MRVCLCVSSCVRISITYPLKVYMIFPFYGRNIGISPKEALTLTERECDEGNDYQNTILWTTARLDAKEAPPEKLGSNFLKHTFTNTQTHTSDTHEGTNTCTYKRHTRKHEHTHARTYTTSHEAPQSSTLTLTNLTMVETW